MAGRATGPWRLAAPLDVSPHPFWDWPNMLQNWSPESVPEGLETNLKLYPQAIKSGNGSSIHWWLSHGKSPFSSGISQLAICQVWGPEQQATGVWAPKGPKGLKDVFCTEFRLKSQRAPMASWTIPELWMEVYSWDTSSIDRGFPWISCSIPQENQSMDQALRPTVDESRRENLAFFPGCRGCQVANRMRTMIPMATLYREI